MTPTQSTSNGAGSTIDLRLPANGGRLLAYAGKGIRSFTVICAWIKQRLTANDAKVGIMLKTLFIAYLIGIVLLFGVSVRTCNPQTVRVYFGVKLFTVAHPSVAKEDWDRHCRRHPEDS